MSVSLNIRQALEKRLEAIAPTIDTVWQNTEYTPVVGTPYQRVHLLRAQPENPVHVSGGSGFYRESGVLHVMLFYPRLTGSADAEARADLIRAQFPYGLSLTDDGVTVTIDNTPEIGDGRRDGDRWAVPVKVRWFSNIHP